MESKSLLLQFPAITRQGTCVQRNIKACSCNHCSGGKAVTITYSKCMFVALGVSPYCHLWPAGSAIFFYTISYVCVYFLYNVCMKNLRTMEKAVV